MRDDCEVHPLDDEFMDQDWSRGKREQLGTLQGEADNRFSHALALVAHLLEGPRTIDAERWQQRCANLIMVLRQHVAAQDLLPLLMRAQRTVKTQELSASNAPSSHSLINEMTTAGTIAQAYSRDSWRFIRPGGASVERVAATTFLQQSGHGRPVIQSLRAEVGRRGKPSGAMEDIVGTLPALQAAIELLTWAMTLPSVDDNSCIVTWQLDDDVFLATPTLLQDWNMALRRWLERGRDIHHIVNRSRDQCAGHPKAAVIAENLLSLLGSRGHYKPYFVPADSNSSGHQERVADERTGDSREQVEYVIVPGVGAVTLKLAQGERSVTSARFTPPGRDLDALVGRFRTTLATTVCAYSAFHRWPDRGYHEGIVRLEDQPGDRYVVIDGLSDSVIPYLIHCQRAQEVCEQRPDIANEVDHVLAWQKRRTAAVLRNMQAYQYCDVTSRRAIERLVRDGRYQTEDIWTAYGANPLTPKQVKMVLAALIGRLQSHSRYHLLLLEDNNADLCGAEVLVKPGHAAFVEFWLTDVYGLRVRSDVEIVEPTVVQAYCEAIVSTTTARAERSKTQVIEYLNEQLEAVDHC